MLLCMRLNPCADDTNQGLCLCQFLAGKGCERRKSKDINYETGGEGDGLSWHRDAKEASSAISHDKWRCQRGAVIKLRGQVERIELACLNCHSHLNCVENSLTSLSGVHNTRRRFVKDVCKRLNGAFGLVTSTGDCGFRSVQFMELKQGLTGVGSLFLKNRNALRR